MHNLGFALEAGWKVLAAGRPLGAGLPMLFAFGVRSPAYGAGGAAEARAGAVPHRAGTVAGYALFLIVLLGMEDVARLAAGGWPLADPPDEG